MEGTRNSLYIDGEDFISRLPDNLIHHIFSFNDTKFAVQTCVLSKRWIGIWKSLPVLNFNRSSFSYENTKRFIEFVYMVFMFHDDSDVQKFSVDWEKSAYNDTVIMNVNLWSLNAVKYNVQEISITIDQLHHSSYEIPHGLLNCKTLRKLEIQVFETFRYVDIILPRSIKLPQLKELIISGLSISSLQLSKRFFSSCPVLEELIISDCDNQRNLNLIVDSLNLKKFVYRCSHRHFSPQTDTNIIKLCAPNLEDFICRFYLTQDYFLDICYPPSSMSFRMILTEKEEDENAETYEKLSSKEKDVYAKRLVKYLCAVYLVKNMRLSPGFLEVLSRASDLLDCRHPQLSNLQYLVLEMWPTRGCLRAVAYLLSISPNIADIYLELKESNDSNLLDVGDDWEAGFSLPGMLSHLRYVEFIDAEGCDAEFKLLSFLLANAKVLKRVGVTFRSSVTSRDRIRYVKRYKNKFRSASSSVEFAYNIKFSW